MSKMLSNALGGNKKNGSTSSSNSKNKKRRSICEWNEDEDGVETPNVQGESSESGFDASRRAVGDPRTKAPLKTTSKETARMPGKTRTTHSHMRRKNER